jgi:hypothetical protein
LFCCQYSVNISNTKSVEYRLVMRRGKRQEAKGKGNK